MSKGKRDRTQMEHGCASNRFEAFQTNLQPRTARRSGKPFVWSLSSDEFCGRLTVHVHLTRFLAEGVIHTPIFNVGGHKWYFELLRTQGHLGGYLYTKNQSDVAVHYSVAVVNLGNNAESVVKGSTRKFEPFDCWGFKLASISKLKNPEFNFLSNDGFLEVRLDVRLRHKDNERQSSKSSHKSGICVWKLRDLHRQNPWVMKSKEFTIGSTTWVLHLYPTGEGLVGKHMAVGLQCLSHKSVRAKVALFPTNSLESHRITKEDLIERTLSTTVSIPGRREFLHRDKLQDSELGYIDDENCFLLAAYISLEDAEDESPNQQAQDLRKENCEGHAGDRCFLCLDQPSTSGIIHGLQIHRALCSTCARILYTRWDDSCPLCRTSIDYVIEPAF